MTPTRIDELARRAGQAIRDRADDVDRSRPPLERLRRRRDTGRAVLASVLVAVVLAAGALVVLQARPGSAPIIGEGETTPSERAEPHGPEDTPEAITPKLTIASGTYEGSDQIWTMRAWLTEEGLCIELEGLVCGGLPTGDVPTVERPLGFVGSAESSAPEEYGCLFGPVHPAVTKVEVTFLGGTTTTLTPFGGGELPADFYAACWDGHRRPLVVEAFDDQGKLLGSEQLNRRLDSAANDLPTPEDTWFGPDGSAVGDDIITLLRGPAHCEWEDALLLHVGWPLGTEKSGQVFRQYVRDPNGVLPDDRKLADFLAETTLPEDAEFTGYHAGSAELWIDPVSEDSSIYLVAPDHVEQWPRTDPPLLCD